MSASEDVLVVYSGEKELSLKYLKVKQSTYILAKDQKSILAILQKEQKPQNSKSKSSQPLQKKPKSTEETMASFDQSQEVSGLFEELSLHETLIPSVFQGCCKGFVKIYSDYCEMLDSRLFSWKESIGLRMKSTVESVRALIKENESTIDLDYNKRLGNFSHNNLMYR